MNSNYNLAKLKLLGALKKHGVRILPPGTLRTTND